MFKINNSSITLNKHDKANLLKKILELKNLSTFYDKQYDDQSDKQCIVIHQLPQKDAIIVQPTQQRATITDTDDNYLSSKDKELLQLFINTLDLHTFDIWDNISKKYKLLYTLLRNGDDPNIQIDNIPYRYSYSDLLFIQMLINYNMYTLPTWKKATLKIKDFFDEIYSIFNVQTTSTDRIETNTPLTVTAYQRSQYSQEENKEDSEDDSEDDSESEDEELQYKQNVYSDIEFETDSDVSSFDFDDSDDSDNSDNSDNSDDSNDSDKNDKSK